MRLKKRKSPDYCERTYERLTGCHSICLANRAKQIKTHAKINQDATDKLVSALREENEKLKKMMEKGVMEVPGADPSMNANGNLTISRCINLT